MKVENIKFKAKNTLDGKWIKGDLVHHKDSDNVWITDYENQLTSPVNPSTVCQFTGLTDYKGNEIWEGDIVHDSYDLLCIDNLYEVVYIEEEGTFAFKSLDKVDNYEPFVNLFEVYVVGNKFDKEK